MRLTGEPACPPAEILSEIAAHEADERRRRLYDFAQSLSVEDMRSLLRQIDGMTGEESRNEVRLMLLARLAELQPREAAHRAAELTDNAVRGHALNLVMDTWTQADPEAAATWLQEFNGPERDRLVDGVISTWASADYEKALNWAQNSANDAVKERALVHLSYRWLETAPAREAMEFALALQSSTNQLVSTLASQWATRDPKAAAAWAAQLPEGPQRAQIIASLTAAWAATAPRDAAAFAASLPGGEVQADAMVSAISGWARSDPQETARWAALFPDDGMRTLAYTHLVPAWTERDPASAAEWLMTMPEGPVKDAAFDSFSGALADRYPAIALSIAQGISDPVLRRDRVDFVARRWLAASPEAAAAGLRTAAVPEEIVSRLIANAPSPR